jgi:hypothetical protein
VASPTVKAQVRRDAHDGQMVGGRDAPRWRGDGRRRFLAGVAAYKGRGEPAVNGDDLGDFLE